MGNDMSVEKRVSKDETPYHKVYLSEYYIGKYPVTNSQYGIFLQESGYQSRRIIGPKRNNIDDCPVACVLWKDAVAYCKWLSEKTSRMFILPTEAEWEKAASWDETKKEKSYFSWGNSFDEGLLTFESASAATEPVGLHSPEGDSPYGCTDMMGNVSEWCLDWYLAEEYLLRAGRKVIDPQGPPEGTLKVLRGGATRIKRNSVTARRGADPNSNGMGYDAPYSWHMYLPGFRVCMEV